MLSSWKDRTFYYSFQRQYDASSQQRHRIYMRDKLDDCKDPESKIHGVDIKAHYGCVNAIAFSNDGEYFVSGGDDRRVLLWRTQKAISLRGKYDVMKGQHNSNVFCLAFDNRNKKIYSGGNDEQVIVHDAATRDTVDVFTHQSYALSVDPTSDDVFASAGDDGRVLIFDLRKPPSEDPFLLAKYPVATHSVTYNPVEPRLLATANSREGVALWDVRKPRVPIFCYASQQSSMSVSFNHRGDRMLCLRRRLPPVVYTLDTATPFCQFDHSGYYNSCTLKSGCFAGDDDQYIVSGSDNFSVYIWKVPEHTLEFPWENEAHLILKGHRSIVNQVRFSRHDNILLSSGVEKVIKAWSPFPISESLSMNPRPDDDCSEREVGPRRDYLDLVMGGARGGTMNHDYSLQSTEEDQRMLAFFDTLVQRDVEGFSSSSTDSEDEFYSQFVQELQTSDESDPESPSRVEGDGEAGRGNASDSEDSSSQSDRDTSRSESDSTDTETEDGHWSRERGSPLSRERARIRGLLRTLRARRDCRTRSGGRPGGSSENVGRQTTRRTISQLIEAKRTQYLQSALQATERNASNLKVKRTKWTRTLNISQEDSSVRLEVSQSDDVLVDTPPLPELTVTNTEEDKQRQKTIKKLSLLRHNAEKTGLCEAEVLLARSGDLDNHTDTPCDCEISCNKYEEENRAISSTSDSEKTPRNGQHDKPALDTASTSSQGEPPSSRVQFKRVVRHSNTSRQRHYRKRSILDEGNTPE